MNEIESKFAAMGARLKLDEDNFRFGSFALNIGRDQHGEFFHIRFSQDARHRLDFSVLQAVPKERHLLLLARTEGPSARKERFLCGYDERHWFVAAVPRPVSTVEAAREALKPQEVLERQGRLSLKPGLRQNRHNAAFQRQGEWFFLPEPDLAVDDEKVLRWEPIRRGQRKPHRVERLYRQGGAPVYVSRRFADGISEGKYRELTQGSAEARRQTWRVMVRGAAVFAQGGVRHPDHATLHLPCWHRVLPNREDAVEATSRVAFLD